MDELHLTFHSGTCDQTTSLDIHSIEYRMTTEEDLKIATNNARLKMQSIAASSFSEEAEEREIKRRRIKLELAKEELDVKERNCELEERELRIMEQKQTYEIK